MEIISTTEFPIEHAIGPPPKVVPWEPTCMAVPILFEVRIPPRGKPFAMPLAKHRISGVILNCSYAKKVPVLPIPDWTSSIIIKALCFLANCLILVINFWLAFVIPDCHWTNSSITADVLLENKLSRSFILL